MTADLVLAHLYPDLLLTYGDRGNVLALEKRAEWRGFRVEVVATQRGDRLPESAGLIVIGGGTDRVQGIVGSDLMDRRAELGDAVERGCVVLGVCGGYQFLGHRYVAADGSEIRGLGLLDVETVAGSDRIIGRVRATASLWGHEFELVGFENHAGRTSLGAEATPLATVDMGVGNGGTGRSGGTEGAVQATAVGTYLHGPVLPLNPAFADALLERALTPLIADAPLEPLPDEMERLAHSSARSLKR